jgi:hypothetical protein
VPYIELHAPTNSTQKLKLIGKVGNSLILQHRKAASGQRLMISLYSPKPINQLNLFSNLHPQGKLLCCGSWSFVTIKY